MNKQFNEILLKKLNIDEYIKLFHIIKGKKKEAQKAKRKGKKGR